MDKSQIILNICGFLNLEAQDLAKEAARRDYPFVRGKASTRRLSPSRSTGIFIRDGFIDRYTGKRLVFPGTLRVLSLLLPEEFPYHKNWKMDEAHIMYWELFPTLDHIVPVARGGEDTDTNIVCTSQLRNSAKANWTLEELGWSLFDPGELEDWDGLIHWFVSYVEKHGTILKNGYLFDWHKAAKECLSLRLRASL